MNHSRRHFLAAATALSMAGCVGSPASRSSYMGQIVNPQHRNAVFDWVDAALQQVRDQRLAPPRAAYVCAMPMAAGFLAANGIVEAYDEPFGIGAGPRDADPEVAYGVAFATAAAEAFQQPFLFERIAFLNRFPGSEAKSLGVAWGRAVGRKVLAMRTGDGSEPSKVNYYLGALRKAHRFAAVATHGSVLQRAARPRVRFVRTLPVSGARADRAVDDDERARSFGCASSTIRQAPNSPRSSTPSGASAARQHGANRR